MTLAEMPSYSFAPEGPIVLNYQLSPVRDLGDVCCAELTSMPGFRYYALNADGAVNMLRRTLAAGMFPGRLVVLRRIPPPTIRIV
jgi:hypothetical protein